MNNFKIFEEEKITQFNQYIEEYLNKIQCHPRLKEAMLYSVKAGGKRIRPLLIFIILDALNTPISDDAYRVGSALELVHTYSLIHDDLPAMDNDDLRRGMPTNHKQFGEAIAILAGDALLTEAFKVITTSESLAPALKVKLIDELSDASGPRAMIDGQVGDILGEETTYTLEQVQHVHEGKTGALLKYACLAGAQLANADKKQQELIVKYGELFGLAFQIYDDILDIVGSQEKLGKKVHKDLNENKNTYPNLLGLKGAQDKLDQVLFQIDDVLLKLEAQGTKIEFMKMILKYFKVGKI